MAKTEDGIRPINGIAEVSAPYLRRLQTAATFDAEAAHSMADEVLCDLLEKLGYGDVVARWRSIDKWYA